MTDVKTVKMCDMPIEISLKVFEMLNPSEVKILKNDSWFDRFTIITDTEPKDLVYPEGWYYAKGHFRNKHMSTTGFYQEVRMGTSDGKYWAGIAKYCTLDN